MRKSIKTTSEENYGIEQWRTLPNERTLEVPARSHEITSFYNVLWPVAEPYVSPMNPIFLVDLHAQRASSAEMTWLVRDGLVPLIWFFTNNPEPGTFKARLRIHSDFEEFVPDAWRPQVELYEFLADGEQGFEDVVDPMANAPKELLLMGLVMPSVCSLDTVEKDLEAIVKFFGGPTKIKSVRTRAFLPMRFESSNEVGASYYNRYMALIHKYIGNHVEYLEFEALKWLYPEKGTYVHEFNERWVFSDSYLSLLALSKKTHFIPTGQVSGGAKTFDKIYPVYPHVSCGVRRKFKKPFVDYLNGSWVPETQSRSKKFYQSMYSYPNKQYPWPRWFDSWCKNI